MLYLETNESICLMCLVSLLLQAATIKSCAKRSSALRLAYTESTHFVSLRKGGGVPCEKASPPTPLQKRGESIMMTTNTSPLLPILNPSQREGLCNAAPFPSER